MPTAIDILNQARFLIEKGWTQGAPARTARGRVVLAHDRTARCFCLVAALYWAADLIGADARQQNRAYMALKRLIKGSLSGWNDEEGRTREEVLALIDRAIARLRGREVVR